MVKIGDKVKFLNEVGGGIVTKIINEKIVHVENEDGFEIPTLISQLVLDHPQNENKDDKNSTQSVDNNIKPEVIQATEKINPLKTEQIFLAFVPENEKNPEENEIKAFLVNDSKNQLLFHFSKFDQKTYKTVNTGQLELYSKIYLDSLWQENLLDLPEFCFQILPYEEEMTSLYNPVIKTIKVNPVKFYKGSGLANSSYFDSKAFLISITENTLKEYLRTTDSDNMQKIALKKGKSITNKPSKKKKAELFREIDLHINELIDNTTGLSNHEILEIQMDRFHREINDAIKKGVKKIVFIHGIGNGILKAEIIKQLNTKYKKYYFQDASFREYGYGATMVILRKG